jgi:archaellum component FlaF (FlaF/FlaG flagellin family)
MFQSQLVISLKKCFILICCLLCHSILYSQNKSTILGIGSNVIDDTFTANYKPFNISEQWNVGKVPSYLSVSSELINRIYIGFSITTNEYKTGKLVNGTFVLKDKDYFAIDLLANYQLLNPDNTSTRWSFFDPFVTLGLGTTTLDAQEFKTVNYGFGFYIWFPRSRNCNCSINSNERSNWGIIISSIGKSSFEQNIHGNQIQHTVGLCYKLN